MLPRRALLAALALTGTAHAAPVAGAAPPRPQRLARNPQQPDQDWLHLWRAEGTQPARPLVILLPPYGGDAAYYDQSRLPGLLAARGIDLAVLHTHATGFLEPAELQRLDALVVFLLAQVGRQPPARVAIGGFSAGGYAALRYAQWSGMAGATALQPGAVFSVDAPLDLSRWYAGLELVRQRLSTRQPQNPFLGEAQYLTGLLRQLMGGTPQQVPQAYQERSVLTAALPDGGNAGQLLGLPVRLYTEPDPEFFLAHGLDSMSTNAIDQIALTNVLRLLGHPAVSLVLTQGRGVRHDLGGMRLPHAWSIVDETELAAWLAAQLSAAPRPPSPAR